MAVSRHFLIAPALARLIGRERLPARMLEGHFPPSRDRRSHVHFEGTLCELVLLSQNESGAWEEEERSEVPSKQGRFLLEVCAGMARYDRVVIGIEAGREVRIDAFSKPGPLALASVDFSDANEAEAFDPPVWFGPEVTDDPAYQRHAIAINGAPGTPDMDISNEALEAVLDLLGGTRIERDSKAEPELRALTTEPLPRIVVAPLSQVLPLREALGRR